MVVGVYGLLRPLRRLMRPASTPSSHSSPMLSNVLQLRPVPSDAAPPSGRRRATRGPRRGPSPPASATPFASSTDSIVARATTLASTARAVASEGGAALLMRDLDAWAFRLAPVGHPASSAARRKLAPGGLFCQPVGCLWGSVGLRPAEIIIRVSGVRVPPPASPLHGQIRAVEPKARGIALGVAAANASIRKSPGNTRFPATQQYWRIREFGAVRGHSGATPQATSRAAVGGRLPALA